MKLSFMGNDSVCIGNTPTSSAEHHVADKNQQRGSPLFSTLCGSLSTFPHMVHSGGFSVRENLGKRQSVKSLSEQVAALSRAERRKTFAPSYC